jgi:hypothetical protein
VPKNGTLQSALLSLFGYQPEMETVMRKKMVVLESQERTISPDEGLNKASLAISPLKISLYHHWSPSLKSTIHIVNPTSCFELSFDRGSSCVLNNDSLLLALLLTFSRGRSPPRSLARVVRRTSFNLSPRSP